MAVQDSNDKIAELLKQAYPPTAASPEFKAKLRQGLSEQAGALGTESPKPLWQQPFLWATAGAAAAIAIALIVYFVVLQSAHLAVTTSDATAIQTTIATLNGNLDSLGTVDAADVSFEWGIGTDYGNETTPELRTAAGSVQTDLSGLAPNTTYHFRIKAVGRDSTAYGLDMQFTTGPAPPVATTSDAAESGTTSATLRGSLDDLGSTASVSVSFEWGLTTSYGNETTPESRTATGKYSADLDGLSPNTTYHFRAKAVGDVTAYGADAQFTTNTTSALVATSDATNVSTNSARLNGELSSLGTASIVKVSFEYGTAPGSYTQTTADQARSSAGAFSADLSSLSPGATYYFRAKADGDGSPVYGVEKSFTVLTAPPSLTTCSATQVHSNTATLNGTLDGLGTASIVNVYFEWGTSASYGNQTVAQPKNATGGFSAGLTGLAPNTTYHFRVKAVGDRIVYGADMVFTTGSTPPPRKTWYLSGDGSGTKTMYEGDTSKPEGTVLLHSNGQPVSQVWWASQSSSGTAYPADNWTVRLALSHITGDHSVIVEIGTWDGKTFVSHGSYALAASGDDNDEVEVYDFGLPVSSFTVPSGGYVAIRLTVNSRWVDVHVGGSQSYLVSPAYPEPTAPAVTTSAATTVEQTTATLNGYLESLGTAGGVAAYFEWGTTAEYGNEIGVGSQTSSGNFSTILANLIPNTTYHFRAKAVGDGTNYGVDMIFTTPP
jgi:phosphodiesterase/alkaline phosphatase D-like protein